MVQNNAHKRVQNNMVERQYFESNGNIIQLSHSRNNILHIITVKIVKYTLKREDLVPNVADFAYILSVGGLRLTKLLCVIYFQTESKNRRIIK